MLSDQWQFTVCKNSISWRKLLSFTHISYQKEKIHTILSQGFYIIFEVCRCSASERKAGNLFTYKINFTSFSLWRRKIKRNHVCETRTSYWFLYQAYVVKDKKSKFVFWCKYIDFLYWISLGIYTWDISKYFCSQDYYLRWRLRKKIMKLLN